MGDVPNKEDLLRRLRGLKELAERGGNEAEMASAAEKFATILAKYNIALAEVDQDAEGTFLDNTRVRGKYNETWRQKCYAMAARLYMCHYSFSARKNDPEYSITHNIVGEPHNAAVAVEMGRYFEATINRLANEAARIAPEVKVNHTQRHRFIRSFRLGATDRLDQRVSEFLIRAKAGKQADTETGGTLPALQSLYDRADALYVAYLKEHKIVLGQKTDRDKRLSQQGLQQGLNAGNNISLSTQVGASASKFALK